MWNHYILDLWHIFALQMRKLGQNSLFSTKYDGLVYGVKTYGIKGKEALMGDWKELNKETLCI